MKIRHRLGAVPRKDGSCRFAVWAPHAARVEVLLTDPVDRAAPMDRQADAYFTTEVAVLSPDVRYRYRLHLADGEVRDRPDPASRRQPDGVHGPSQVVPADFAWSDGGWCGLPLERYVIYELHVGTFSRAGTFEAVIRHLDALVDLGITGRGAHAGGPVSGFPQLGLRRGLPLCRAEQLRRGGRAQTAG